MGNAVLSIWQDCFDVHTLESTQEMNMETVATEQPQAIPSPAPQGSNKASVSVGKGLSSNSFSLESLQDDDLGTSVDNLIDLQSSQGVQPDLSAGTSLSNSDCGLGVKALSDEASAPLASPEISRDKSKMIDEIVETVIDSEVKVDELAKLAAQIDDFDPCAMLKKSEVKVTETEVKFTEDLDINDEKLIDELIKDNDKKDLSGSKNDREATPENENEGGNKSNEKQSSSKSEQEENGEKTNGSMSASTESDGFEEGSPVNGEGEGGVGQEKVPEPMPKKTVKEERVIEQKPENRSPTKTSKSKRKEDKGIEHILKALSSLQSTEEKLAALCKKYADLHEDHRILQSSYKQTQRKLTVTSREKDQLQTEHTKAVMAKSKLESLCRELQKHNQTIRQESLQRAKEEDEKRKEISQKFQTTIGEIQTQMQENHERNKQLREENFELANKLKKFIEQSEAREQQVSKVIQHRELEQKLADAKLEQASAILMEEQGRSQKEKELILLQSTEYLKKLQLKDQELQMYKERYDEFQSTIKKSEEMFSKFKTEMDKMGKRCKKLEKDGAQWKTKWEGGNRALLEMAEEKTRYDRERGMLMAKVSKLESLCRAMQAERQARKLLETEQMADEMSKLGLKPEEMSVTNDAPVMETEGAEIGGSSSPTEGAGDLSVNSDNTSCASEQTGTTVIKQEPLAPDSSQSEASSEGNGQSENQNLEANSPSQSEDKQAPEPSQSNEES
ncbi:alpha-taxilin-like isoform X3 [Mya arenaria]|uniref:alpha-taxilin-like isoform X3 n=1 Tax=Mya arenaria TaxID=6604 RepID=UPI0022E2ACED|nr:alpha-taxilin-like isoform X3 [Mya arenaria]